MGREASLKSRDRQSAGREAGGPGPLLLYGASGYALAMASVLRHAFAPVLAAETIAFVDDLAGDRGETLQDVPILSFEECRRAWPDTPFIVTVGAPRARRRLVGKVEAAGGSLLSFYERRPSSLFPGVTMRAGCFVGPNTYVGPKTTIGAHAQVMSNCSIGHDVEIGAFCTICPSCPVSGYVVLEAGVFRGAGTTIVNGRRSAPLRIGRGAVVWAGSVVTADVPCDATFAGNPAVPTREAAVARRNLRARRVEPPSSAATTAIALRPPPAGLLGFGDALAPSPPVRDTTVERIPVCRPSLPSLHDLAVHIGRIDASRRYSNHGGLVVALQDRLRALVATTADVVLAASGTSALAGAILATAGRPRPGRELCLVPAYTFIGTISAIEQAGYRPHFVDVDGDSWTLDAERLIRHELVGGVGLVVPVAPYGRPVPQAPWQRFMARSGIPVVIDGAACLESLLAAPETYAGGVPVAVSFHATKVFCTAEGGAVFTGDAATWRATMQCLNFGYDLDRTCRRPAINGKMSEYHAAIGLAELDGWSAKCAKFAGVAASYRTRAPSPDVGRLHLAPDLAANYALLEAHSAAQGEQVGRALQRSGIGWRRWYGLGAHRQPYCLRFGRDETPVTDDLAGRLIGLPMSVDLADESVDEVLATIAAAAEYGSSDGIAPPRNDDVSR